MECAGLLARAVHPSVAWGAERGKQSTFWCRSSSRHRQSLSSEARGYFLGKGRPGVRSSLLPCKQRGAKRREKVAAKVRNRNEENPSSGYGVNTQKLFSNGEFNGI